MSAFNEETVLSVHHWNDTLFSFTTTRNPTLRFKTGQFVMIGLMVLANLLKNALSYGELNTLVVRADGQSIEVSNGIDAQKNEQGFGVGLYLIEHLSQRMAWQLTIDHQSSQFVVRITF